MLFAALMHQFRRVKRFTTLETDLIASIGQTTKGLALEGLLLLQVLLVHACAFVLLVDHGAHDEAGLATESDHEGHEHEQMRLVLQSGLARGVHKFD